jgi:alanyl-tRNA synthetase
MFKPIITQLETLVKKEATKETIASYRVIADHLRASAFMLSEGILFDKEGRGYVLRRILRRAVRHGYLLGLRKPFMAQLLDTLIGIMGEHYTQLKEKATYIKEQLTLEEDRFFKTIDLGMSLFNEELNNTQKIFSGEVAFKLYDTFGFPLDLTQDMLRNMNLQVDTQTFETLMNEQKQKAKASWKGSGDIQNEGDFKQILEKYPKNEFVGYTQNSSKTKIVTLLDESFKEVSKLTQGQTGWIMLEQTPFYALSGGQVGDIGIIEDDKSIAEVLETKKFFDLNLSKIRVEQEFLEQNEEVMGVVVNRYEIAKHHSATHLLQSALKMVLGETVSQAGSLNDSSRLRFDFTYPKAMTTEEINEVEDLVNSMISRAIAGNVEELPIEEAKQKGAIAMFGEKYGDLVRVVSFGDFSVEFCGGIHVKNTSDIGSFFITKESGVSAGVRRIEAVCGLSAINYAKQNIQTLAQIQEEVKNNDPLVGIAKLKEQIKELKKELQSAQNAVSTPIHEEMINGCKVVVEVVENGDLKKIVDDLKNGNENIAVLLLQAKEDKVMIVAGSKNTSLKAGDWIKNIAPIVGGGGGGRPDFAQAGGKDASKINEAKEAALKYAKENI